VFAFVLVCWCVGVLVWGGGVGGMEGVDDSVCGGGGGEGYRFVLYDWLLQPPSPHHTDSLPA
jgi:hypothetical protein